MAHEHEDPTDGQRPAHTHNCGGLFGCGDEKGTGVIREDIKDHAFDRRAADRLLHMDEVDQERFDGFLSARGRARRQLLRASSFMSALAAVGPRFTRLAQAAGTSDTPATGGAGGGGRVHTVESNNETVRLGVFDATLPPILTIESGDSISFPNTWSHFLNELQPGVPISRLAELRTSNPGRGPHSIIGPIAVKDAEPGWSRSAIGVCAPSRGAQCSTILLHWAPGCCPRISRKDRSNMSTSTLQRCREDLRPTSIFR